MRTGYFIMYI